MQWRNVTPGMAAEFLGYSFQLEILEQGHWVPQALPTDSGGNYTFGLLPGYSFTPRAYPSKVHRVKVLEGIGQFYNFGKALHYRPGSVFFVPQQTGHGFVQVLTKTVAVKSRLDFNELEDEEAYPDEIPLKIPVLIEV